MELTTTIPIEVTIGSMAHGKSKMTLRVTLDKSGASLEGDAIWDALKDKDMSRLLHLLADQIAFTPTPPAGSAE